MKYPDLSLDLFCIADKKTNQCLVMGWTPVMRQCLLGKMGVSFEQDYLNMSLISNILPLFQKLERQSLVKTHGPTREALFKKLNIILKDMICFNEVDKGPSNNEEMIKAGVFIPSINHEASKAKNSFYEWPMDDLGVKLKAIFLKMSRLPHAESEIFYTVLPDNISIFDKWQSLNSLNHQSRLNLKIQKTEDKKVPKKNLRL